MKAASALPVVALLLCGCFQDPREPLDMARRDIHDIQAFQLQAVSLQPLQEDLRRALLRDPRVRSASVGLHFGCSDSRPYGARLEVQYVLLLEVQEPATASTQPADANSEVQDAVRDALAACGWEVEEVCPYSYKNTWRFRGRIRGEGKPPSAGAGLDLLPGPR